jgi:ZIP family zinc transporter
MEILIAIMIPFIGTMLGSSMVFLLKNNVKPFVQKLLLGFASGVMIAASIWSLIIPAIEMIENSGKIGWIPAAVGFMFRNHIFTYHG